MKKLLFDCVLCVLMVVPSAIWATTWTVGVLYNGSDLSSGSATGTFTSIIPDNSYPLGDVTWTFTNKGEWSIQDKDSVILMKGTCTGTMGYSSWPVVTITNGTITPTMISNYVSGIDWAVGSTGTLSGLLTYDSTNTCYTGNLTINSPAVPEPMSIILGIMGLGSIAGFKKFRK